MRGAAGSGSTLASALIGTVLGLLTTRAAGNAYAEVEPVEGALRCRLQLAPDARVERAEATLVVRELAQQYGYDNFSQQREHVVHQQAIPLVAEPGQPGWFAAALPMPPEGAAPCTLSLRDAQIGWSVRFHAKVSGSPDVEDSIALVVRPARGPAAAADPTWTTG